MPVSLLPRKTIWQSFVEQARVITALLLREASLRLGPFRFGHFLIIMEVLWGTTFLGFIWLYLGRPAPYGDSVIFYMFTGMFPFTLYRTLHTRVSAALDANKALLSYPVVRPVDTLIARAILESMFQLAALIIFYPTFIWMGAANFPAHPVEMFAALGATFLLGFGLGATGMILRSMFKSWAIIDGMIARTLFFISGIFFPIEYLPQEIRDVLYWNPLVHAIEWFRYSIYYGYDTQTLNKTYLLAFALICTIFGLVMERIRRPLLLQIN
ncbi:ABC transporter permease [Thermopetrobacter sp. TC1]|uniref:ABC transporter permease n=1 Tax=Thermopetrobacter sp. TC1 TaxID=1495045 RepID=UPI00056DF8E7|nr:ABC transporter permease [Thermopetrobacter sp. TC1]